MNKTNTETSNNPECKNKNGNNYSDEMKETELLIENGNKPLSSLPNYLTDAEPNPFAQVEQQNFLESVASMVSNQTLHDDYSNDGGNGGMIFHFVVLNIIWICTAILFNGLFFYVGVLPGTPFANTYYTTLADIIAYVSIGVLL